MNRQIYLIEILGFIILFTGLIMVPLCRNPVWWIHDYPKDIQEEYFRTHERIPAAPLSTPALLKKGFAVVLATAALSCAVIHAGAVGFTSAFLLSYGIWLAVDWYDCFFLDWVLFANIRRIRLPGTEHMNRAYHQKKYHFVHSVIGMGVGLIPCLMAGALVNLAA